MKNPKFTSPGNRMLYYNRVWEIVRQIPPGKVATYGQIGMLVELPEGIDPGTYRAFAPRWVGGAMKSCPQDVPWQRVINAQGKISLTGEAGLEQRVLLESEGVKFDKTGRINLSVYQWKSDPDESAQLELPI